MFSDFFSYLVRKRSTEKSVPRKSSLWMVRPVGTGGTTDFWGLLFDIFYAFFRKN